jgi:hypothetical protein
VQLRDRIFSPPLGRRRHHHQHGSFHPASRVLACRSSRGHACHGAANDGQGRQAHRAPVRGNGAQDVSQAREPRGKLRAGGIACIPWPPYFSTRAPCLGLKPDHLSSERNVQVSRKNAVLLYVEDPPGSVAGYAIISTRLPPAPKGGNIEKVCVAESM